VSDRDLQAFTGVPGVQRMLLVALVATVALFAERALEASVGQIVFIVSGVILLMVLAVIFRAERRLPLLCDPLVIVFAFMAQFFVIGAPALFLLDFYIFRPLSPERGAFVLGLFAVFVGYQTRLGAAIAEMIPNFEGPRRRMPWVWFESRPPG